MLLENVDWPLFVLEKQTIQYGTALWIEYRGLGNSGLPQITLAEPIYTILCFDRGWWYLGGAVNDARWIHFWKSYTLADRCCALFTRTAWCLCCGCLARACAKAAWALSQEKVLPLGLGATQEALHEPVPPEALNAAASCTWKKILPSL